MVRSRVNNAPLLDSFEAVDRSIRRIGQIDSLVRTHEAKFQQIVDKEKERLVSNTSGLMEEKKRLEKDIQDFAEYYMDRFEGKKSRKLNFGLIGFRKTTKLVTVKGWTWNRVVGKLEELKLFVFLKIHKSVDKEAVKNSGRTEQELKTWGVQIETEDEFFYEVDEAQIAEMPNMKIISKTG